MNADTAYVTAVADTLGHEGGCYDGSGSHDPNPKVCERVAQVAKTTYAR